MRRILNLNFNFLVIDFSDARKLVVPDANPLTFGAVKTQALSSSAISSYICFNTTTPDLDDGDWGKIWE